MAKPEINNIKDLEELFYNSDNKEQKEKYESAIKTEILSPMLEDEAKKIFQPIGDAVKINPDRNSKTFDYEIKNKKILLEVTSIDIPVEDEKISTHNVDKKIKKAFRHIRDKQYTGNFICGGIIFYSFRQIFLRADTLKKLMDKKWIKKMMTINKIDYLIVHPIQSSVTGMSSLDICPSIVYIKKEHDEKFIKLSNYIKRNFID